MHHDVLINFSYFRSQGLLLHLSQSVEKGVCHVECSGPWVILTINGQLVEN